MTEEESINECPHCFLELSYFDDLHDEGRDYEETCPRCEKPILVNLCYDFTYYIRKDHELTPKGDS